MATSLVFTSSPLGIGDFSWTGDYTAVNLIAAGTIAQNGALRARRPDHDMNWTVVGILAMGARQRDPHVDRPDRQGLRGRAEVRPEGGIRRTLGVKERP